MTAGVPHINLSLFQGLTMPLPPLPTQRKIAAVMSAYDDLIENNNRRIGILEEMARRIYREWFVEFRYPGHEDVTLVDSELGPIPDGWQVGTLDDLVVLQRGFDLPTTQRERGSVPGGRCQRETRHTQLRKGVRSGSCDGSRRHPRAR